MAAVERKKPERVLLAVPVVAVLVVVLHLIWAGPVERMAPVAAAMPI